MNRLITRLVIMALAAASLVLTLGAGLPAAALDGAARTGPADGPTLDGLQLGYLPDGLGTSTDFDYEFDDVAFVSRVWESPAPSGGWRVDLNLDVMRGARLVDAQSLHDWFIAYEERPPAEARYHRISVNGRPGWQSRDQIFWLVRPGVRSPCNSIGPAGRRTRSCTSPDRLAVRRSDG